MKAMSGGFAGGGGANLIHFTVTVNLWETDENGEYLWAIEECAAEEGMTWGDWVNSGYNTIGAYESDGCAAIDDPIECVRYIADIGDIIMDGNSY